MKRLIIDNIKNLALLAGTVVVCAVFFNALFSLFAKIPFIDVFYAVLVLAVLIETARRNV